MRTLILVALISLGVTLMAADGLPIPALESDLAGDSAVEWGQLDNGLVYALRRNSEPPGKVSIRLLVTVGSRYETEPEQGLAHYLEHMAFNGTERFPPGTLIEQLQAMGVAFGSHTNAHTGFDETVYKLDLPSVDDAMLDTGLSIMADWARGMLLGADEIEHERGVIQAEMRDRDGADLRAYKAMFAAMYDGAGIAKRFPIGIPETIAAIDATQMRAFYDRWYRPESMVLVVVGDIEPAQVQPRLEALFAPLAAMGEASAWAGTAVTASDDTQFVVVQEPELKQSQVRLAMLRPEEKGLDTAEDRVRELYRDLAAAVLSQRLNEIAQADQAPILNGGGGTYPYLGHRHALVQATIRPGQAMQAVQLVVTEQERLRRFGPSSEELRVVQAEYQAGLDRAVATAGSRTHRQLADGIYGSVKRRDVFMSPEQAQTVLQQALSEVDAETVRAAWDEVWQGTRQVLVVTSRETLGDDAEQRVAAAMQAALAAEIAAPAEAAAVTWAYASAATDAAAPVLTELGLGVITATLPNAVSVAVLPRSEQPNEVLVQLSLHLPAEPIRAGLSGFASRGFMAGGLGKHDRSELKRVLAGTTARLSGPSLDGTRLVFRGSCRPEELQLCLEQLVAWLTDPGWRDSAFERAQTAWLEQIAASERDLDQQLWQQWGNFEAGGYPQFRTTTAGELRALTVADVRAWLEPALQNAPAELAIVGDVQSDAVAAALAATVAKLAPRTAVPIQADLTAPGALAPRAPLPAGAWTAVVEASVARALILLAWPTTDAGDVRDARRLGLLAQALDELLRRKVREELGEAYSPVARHRASTDFENSGALFSLVGVAPGREQEVLPLIAELAAELVAEGIPEDVFEQIHKPALANLPAYRRTNGYWLGSVVAQVHSQPQRLAWSENMLADYAAITREELHAMAQLYLKPEHALSLVLVSPEASTDPAPEAAVAE
ncbi:MAG: insulinase family protein [Planctomycetota bacterium]|jgi:zinc protease|nr:insulinase family protein [Planctomycetota bacterium]